MSAVVISARKLGIRKQVRQKAGWQMTGQMMGPMVKMRDTRLDVFRALALLSIFINHVPGTIYEKFTHREFGFSDSAEAFVLISGLAVALAYSSKFVEGIRLLLSLRMARRSLTL
jgi:hypothetical protein